MCSNIKSHHSIGGAIEIITCEVGLNSKVPLFSGYYRIWKVPGHLGNSFPSGKTLQDQEVLHILIEFFLQTPD